MANHQFKNFTVKERVLFENALHDAIRLLPEILKDARQNTSVLATRAYHMYFGAPDKKRRECVVGILSCMDYVLSAGRITFTRKYTGGYSSGKSTCAGTSPPYGHWADQTPRQMAESSHTHPDAYVMNVGTKFYTAQNSLDRSVKSAQFNTVCHELSHLVGDTLDPVYGNLESLQLALHDPDRAVRCAENYGFYCEYFYQHIK